MDIFSFTTIILMLFIIIGAYLIFTDQTEGRTKIILTVAVLVCFIYIFMNLGIFKSYTEAKSSPMDASQLQTVTTVDTTSTSYTLSTWIYITDWNNGSEKNVFSMTNDISAYTPKIKLGQYNNELIITYYTSPSSGDNLRSVSLQNLRTALTTYNTAKAAWIAASNAERSANGNVYTTGTTEATGGVETTKNTTLSNATAVARTAMINARKAYDGGDESNATYTPSSRTLKTDATAGSLLDTDFERTPATVVESVTSPTYDNYTSFTSSNNPAKNYVYYGTSALKKYMDSSSSSQVEFQTDPTQEYSLETIRIKEISIQKWVSVVVSFGDNTVDTYINGKLVDSHVSTGSVQKVTTVADNTTLNWGGFTGYISASRYYPRFLTPQEAWSIYKAGFSDSLMGNFLNQYNAKFTFSQNQVEKASFYII
jgi:hypothetical protein